MGAVNGYWWFGWSLQFLLFAVLLSVYMLYDGMCFGISCALTLLPLWTMYRLHKAHVGVVWPLVNFSPVTAASQDESSDSASFLP